MTAKKSSSGKKGAKRSGPAKKSGRTSAEAARTAQDDIALPPQRNCGTMANHMHLLETNPGFRSNLFALEEATQKYRSTGLKIGDVPIATIKVIVHVVYHTPEQ